MNTESMQTMPEKTQKLSILLLFSALAASIIAMFYPVVHGMMRIWSVSEDYSHGYLVIPISCYIIWKKKKELLNTVIRPSWIGMPVTIAAVLLFLIGDLGGIETLKSFSLLILLSGVVLYLFGMDIFNHLLFPILFLLFMIPIPSQFYAALTTPLQLIVSKLSAEIALLLNVPLFREGNVIQLPGSTFEIVQACSGLRSMISLFTLSIVLGYFTMHSFYLKGILFLSSVPIAVLVNVIRVTFMVVSFYYFHFDLTQKNVHTTFGVVIFIISLTALFILQRILSKWDHTISSGSSS